MNRKRILRSWWLWGLVVLFVIFVLPSLLSGGSDYHGVSTTQAIEQIDSGNVTKAVQSDKEQSLQLELKKPFEGKYSKISTQYPSLYSDEITADLVKASKDGTDFKTHVSKENTWLSLLVSLLPILLIVGVLFFVMSQVQGGGNRVMSFGRSKAKLVNKDTPKTTFQDVAGADEAIEELEEIKEFLANPAKFQAIGAKIPKGVLL
jgi:cell division protease FtsH